MCKLKSISNKIALLLKHHMWDTVLLIKTMMVVSVLLIYLIVPLTVLPKGINYYFLYQMLKVGVLLMSVLFLIFSFFWINNKVVYHRTFIKSFYYADLILLLLPMTPIIQYIILNQDILNIYSMMLLFSIFLGIAFFLCFIFPMFYGLFVSRAILMIVGLSFCMTLFNMASVAQDFNWTNIGSIKVQMAIFGSIFVFCLVFYFLNKRYLYIAIVAYFILNTLSIVYKMKSNENQEAFKPGPIYTLLKNKKIVRKPDIFLLTYDSYVENETMLQYGIDNSAQEAYLLKNGFYIYRGTYSVGHSSLASMNRVFDISSKQIGNIRDAVSGNGEVQNSLKQHGYEIFGIFPSDYFFSGIKSSYDQSFPPASFSKNRSSYKLLTAAIFEGEFKYYASYNSTNYEDFIFKKHEILSNKTIKPKFVYSHSRYPDHTQNSGRCLDFEKEMYKLRLDKANSEMYTDINILIKSNPNAIIIINGDHGPYLTKNCTGIHSNPSNGNLKYDIAEISKLDVQDRYGAFLAIKWPKNVKIDPNKITILQDIFPAVLAYLFNDDSIYFTRIEQLTIEPEVVTCGVSVRNGIIIGGKDNGKLLFNSIKSR